MKILLLADFCYNFSGKNFGTERFVYGIAEWINTHTSHTVEILSPSWNKGSAKQNLETETVGKTKIHLFSTHPVEKKGFVAAVTRLKDYFFSAQKLGSFDAYHGIFSMPAIMAAIALGKTKRKKTICTVFRSENINPRFPLIIPLMKSADRVFFNFWETEKEFVEKYGFENTRTMPVWIDETFRPLDTKKTNGILFVGRMVEEKGIFVLAKAFAALKKKHGELKIAFIGGKEQEKELKELLKSLGVDIEADCKFVGFVSEEELNKWYNDSLMVVTPAMRRGNWTWTGLEAMATGTVSIETSKIILPDYNKEFQLLAGINDVESIVACAEKVLDNPEFAAEIRKNGLEVIKNYFKKDSIMNNYLKELESYECSMVRTGN